VIKIVLCKINKKEFGILFYVIICFSKLLTMRVGIKNKTTAYYKIDCGYCHYILTLRGRVVLV